MHWHGQHRTSRKRGSISRPAILGHNQLIECSVQSSTDTAWMHWPTLIFRFTLTACTFAFMDCSEKARAHGLLTRYVLVKRPCLALALASCSLFGRRISLASTARLGMIGELHSEACITLIRGTARRSSYEAHLSFRTLSGLIVRSPGTTPDS